MYLTHIDKKGDNKEIVNYKKKRLPGSMSGYERGFSWYIGPAPGDPGRGP